MYRIPPVVLLFLAVQVLVQVSTAQDASTTVIYQGTCVSSEVDEPVAGATVRIYDGDRIVATTLSQRDGGFELRHVIDSDKATRKPTRALVTAPGRASQVVSLVGSQPKLAIQLAKAVTIRGRVVDADGTAVTDAIVHLGTHIVSGVHDAVSDENGRFQIDDVPEMILQSERDRLLKHRLIASHPQLGMKSVVLEKIPCETDIAFDSVLPDQYGMQFRSGWLGSHEMPNGVSVTFKSEAFHGPNRSTSALIRWPASDGLPEMTAQIHIASDSWGNQDRWTVVWPKDRCQLWIANSMNDNPSIRAIDFSDPTAIVTLYRARKTDKLFPTAGREVYDARVRRLHGKAGKQDIPVEVWRMIRSNFPKVPESDDNHQMYGYQSDREAVTYQRWKVQGTVTDQQGKPLPSIHIRAIRAATDRRLASATTKQDGNYELSFSMKLSEVATNPEIRIKPVLANHFESRHGDTGVFRVACVKRAPTDSLLLGRIAKADFELMPAASLEGNFSHVAVESIAGGRITLTWDSPKQFTHTRSADIDSRGRFRMTDLPTGQNNPLTVELRNASDQVLAEGKIELAAGRMMIDADESWILNARPVPLGPITVSIVHLQKPVAPPDDEAVFANIVRDWIESCQQNNTLAIQSHDPEVWTKVIGGHNVVHVRYRKPKWFNVHTDEGTLRRMIAEIAFPMYDMRPGALFARSGDETLVLESPLIEPTIRLMSHRSLDCFLTQWYQPYIDAWNHPPPSPSANVAQIAVDVDGVLMLDGKPVPKDIHQLSGVLSTAGYDRRDSFAMVTADPLTPYDKLHWVMWKLGQSGWKDRIILRVGQ
ncbi:MAG: hypothetical protein HKN47_11840 [Pirellulaceae bacterium]|nr:hypothetical protein [Pirellulaceae bacterium]